MEMKNANEGGKIRILQFSVANSKGGITQALLENWRLINKEKYKFGFVAIGTRLSFEDQIVNRGGAVHYISCRAEENAERFETELRNIVLQGYDIIHIHTSRWMCSLVEKVAAEQGVKVIFHSHNIAISLIEDNEKMIAARAYHLKKRSELVYDSQIEYWACTPTAAQWMYGNQISRDNIKIVKDAIDTKRFCFDSEMRRKIREKYHIADKLVLGHVGRFAYQKNQEFLLDVLLILKNQGLDVILLTEGKGNKDEFCGKVKKYKLIDEVIMLEEYEKIEELYQAMDIFVFPSRFEGFGRVLLEAQCAGLKCIASSFVPRDVVVTKNVIFEELSAKKWAEAIAKCEDYGRRDMSRTVVEAGYGLEENVKELEKLYQNVFDR